MIFQPCTFVRVSKNQGEQPAEIGIAVTFTDARHHNTLICDLIIDKMGHAIEDVYSFEIEGPGAEPSIDANNCWSWRIR